MSMKIDDILSKYSKKELKRKEWPSKGLSNPVREMLCVYLPYRIVDSIEEWFMSLKKDRFCSVCGLEGHTKSTCPNFLLVDRIKSENPPIVAIEKTITCKPVFIERTCMYADVKDGYYYYEPDKIKGDFKCVSDKKVNKIFLTRHFLFDTIDSRKNTFMGCVNCCKLMKKHVEWQRLQSLPL